MHFKQQQGSICFIFGYNKSKDTGKQSFSHYWISSMYAIGNMYA